MTTEEQLAAFDKRLIEAEKKYADLSSAVLSHGQRLNDHDRRLQIIENPVEKPVQPSWASVLWAKTKASLVKVAKVVAVPLSCSVLTAFITLAVLGQMPGCHKPDPIPDPTPTPVPPVPPIPPTPPAPIPLAGLHVVMMYDKTTVTPVQEDGVLFGRDVRDYLEAKCILDSEGGNKAYWIIHSGADFVNAPAWVRNVIQQHPGKTSYLVVSDGKSGYDGDLPKSKDEAMGILKKWGG